MKKQQKRNNINKNNNDNSNNNNENENDSQMSDKQLSFITLPHREQQVEKVIKSFKATLHRSLPNNMETKIVYTGTKLGSNFQFKNKTKFDHKHDWVYYVKCPECQEDYIREIGGATSWTDYDHSGKYSKSHMFKHILKNNHKHVSLEDFHILRNGYTNSKFKQKISKVLFIKELRPSLNTQETSFPLLLYND